MEAFSQPHFYRRKPRKSHESAPGSLIFIGERKMDSVSIELIDYNREDLNEKRLSKVEAALGYLPQNSVTWLNIAGLHDTEFIGKLQPLLKIHPLILEDILNTEQRPKFEEIDDYLFISLKMLDWDEQQNSIKTEQVSFIVKPNFLVTFQEAEGDVFEPVRERIRTKRGKVRNSGCDYLAYTLLDSIMDHYLFLIDEIGEAVQELEIKVIDNPEKEVLEEINRYKRELNYLARMIRPVRELVTSMSRSESQLISKKTRPYIKDLQGLAIHGIEHIDTYRENLSDYLNIYHTNLTTRMNDVIRVLTVFASIFTPLTFIAGVYGTNFEYFPELSYRYSYLIFWGVNITVAVTLLIFFKRKQMI